MYNKNKMPFGTRRRLRPAFRFTDPVLPLRKNQEKKLKEISSQGLENTSQREEERPSAKAPIKLTLDRDTGKGVNRPTPIVNKAEPSVGNPDAPHPTAQDKAAIGFSAPPKLTQQEDKLLKRLESGDVSLTDAELAVVGAIQTRVNKAPTVKKALPQQVAPLKAVVKNVKKNIAKADKQITKLSAKGMRGKVEAQIKLREVQLKKLRTLLAKCPQCG